MRTSQTQIPRTSDTMSVPTHTAQSRQVLGKSLVGTVVSLLGKREPESSGKDRGKLALRPDTVVASTDSAATTTIRHAVSDRQSTHPTQA
jgi:hypothetical protein